MDSKLNGIVFILVFIGSLTLFSWLWMIGHVIVAVLGASIVLMDMVFIRKNCSIPYVLGELFLY